MYGIKCHYGMIDAIDPHKTNIGHIGKYTVM